jgi:hypothetical protein
VKAEFENFLPLVIMTPDVNSSTRDPRASSTVREGLNVSLSSEIVWPGCCDKQQRNDLGRLAHMDSSLVLFWQQKGQLDGFGRSSHPTSAAKQNKHDRT